MWLSGIQTLTRSVRPLTDAAGDCVHPQQTHLTAQQTLMLLLAQLQTAERGDNITVCISGTAEIAHACVVTAIWR
jgi:hypothetical protein